MSLSSFTFFSNILTPLSHHFFHKFWDRNLFDKWVKEIEHWQPCNAYVSGRLWFIWKQKKTWSEVVAIHIKLALYKMIHPNGQYHVYLPRKIWEVANVEVWRRQSIWAWRNHTLNLFCATILNYASWELESSLVYIV